MDFLGNNHFPQFEYSDLNFYRFSYDKSNFLYCQKYMEPYANLESI